MVETITNMMPADSQCENPKSINLNISTVEVENIFKPCIEEEVNPLEQRWKKIVNDAKWNWKKLFVRRILFGWMGERFRRTQRNIKGSYSFQWQATSLEQQLSHKQKSTPCVFNNRAFFARPYGIKRVHLLLMSKFLEITHPQRVLEVGAGNGVNLFVLSSLFPNIQFSGCELTKGGVEAAKAIAMASSLPNYIQEFSPKKPKDVTSHNRIDFKQGSAAELVYPNGHFDVVFTIQALEQMEEIRTQALKELARVSNRYVIMIEPFRDWNTQPLNRHKIIAFDYFSAFISDLPKYGLRAVGSYSNIPNKLGYGVGMVIAERIVSPVEDDYDRETAAQFY